MSTSIKLLNSSATLEYEESVTVNKPFTIKLNKKPSSEHLKSTLCISIQLSSRELLQLIEVGASCFFDPGYCHTKW